MGEGTQHGGPRVENLPEDAPNSSEGSQSFQDSWFGNIPAGFLVSAILLYVVGWSYIWGFLSAFGLSFRDVNFDSNEVMIMASRGWPPWLSLLVIAFSGFCLAAVLWKLKKWNKRSGLDFRVRWSLSVLCFAFALVILDGLSLVSINRGRGEATKQMSEKTMLPFAELVIAKGGGLQDLLSDPAQDKISGFLVAHGKNGYYLLPHPISQQPKEDHQYAGSVEVIFIPDQAVLGARIGTAIPAEGK